MLAIHKHLFKFGEDGCLVVRSYSVCELDLILMVGEGREERNGKERGVEEETEREGIERCIRGSIEQIKYG